MTDVLGHSSLLGKQFHHQLPDQKYCRSSISTLCGKYGTTSMFKENCQEQVTFIDARQFCHRWHERSIPLAFHLMTSFAALMPRICTLTIALIDELKAAHKIRRMKEIEKSQHE
jgi:hypothetical protein